MRNSILGRLLLVSLVVLGCSTVATALITSTSTTIELTGRFDRDLETDRTIRDELLLYGETHPTWEGVERLVESLAIAHQRQIVLGTAEGAVFVDSTRHAGDDDPIASVRRPLDPKTATVLDPLGLLVRNLDPLGPNITADDQAVNDSIVDAAAACLEGQVLGVWRSTDAAGFARLIIPGDAATLATITTCRESASRAVLDPYVAPAALLDINSTPSDSTNWIGRAGGLRTVLALLAVLLITAVVTLWAGRRVLRPVRAMTNATRRIAAGDRRARVRVDGSDEIARLGDAFNSMADAIERIERERRELVSSVAHELRNPLSNVRGYLEAAEDGVVDADEAWVASLLEETLLLQRLIDDLQDLAMADAGRLHIHREPTDVAALCAQVVNAHTAVAQATGVSVSVDAPDRAMVSADPGRLRQAIGNLVANAIRYTPPTGVVTVAVRNDGGDVEITVTDTGIGIEAEHLPHLFERFYRADASRSRTTGGSGLGLAIVEQLVTAHQGGVDVRSVVGCGSTFTLRLPQLAPDVLVRPEQPSVVR